MKAGLKGFSYCLDIKVIRQYQGVPIKKRLAWLYQLNLLRMAYPRRIIDLQNKFRQGKI